MQSEWITGDPTYTIVSGACVIATAIGFLALSFFLPTMHTHHWIDGLMWIGVILGLVFGPCEGLTHDKFDLPFAIGVSLGLAAAFLIVGLLIPLGFAWTYSVLPIWVPLAIGWIASTLFSMTLIFPIGMGSFVEFTSPFGQAFQIAAGCSMFFLFVGVPLLNAWNTYRTYRLFQTAEDVGYMLGRTLFSFPLLLGIALLLSLILLSIFPSQKGS